VNEFGGKNGEQNNIKNFGFCERLNISAGIYFLKLTAGTDYMVKKLVVLK